jgi:hypothetical protein
VEEAMIKPKWAISIWNDQDWIYLDLGGYSVKVSCSIEGLNKILHLLRARDEDSRFSTEGCPTQDQINHVFYGVAKPRKRTRVQYNMTDEQYHTTLQLLRSMGMVK